MICVPRIKETADSVVLRSDASKRAIAAFFELDAAVAQWESDTHYTTDPEKLEKLFD